MSNREELLNKLRACQIRMPALSLRPIDESLPTETLAQLLCDFKALMFERDLPVPRCPVPVDLPPSDKDWLVSLNG